MISTALSISLEFNWTMGIDRLMTSVHCSIYIMLSWQIPCLPAARMIIVGVRGGCVPHQLANTI